MPSQNSFRVSETARSRGQFSGHYHGNGARQSGYKRSSSSTVTFALPDEEPKRKFSQNLAESTMDEEEQNYHDVDEETKEEEDEEKEKEEEEKEEEEGVIKLDTEETALRDEVNKIIRQIPTLKSEQVHLIFDVLDFPPSYRCNSAEEKKILVYVKNFESQFFTVYPNRKPLFLCSANECDVKKFVCTTLKPTLVRTELNSWEGAASFVSDHFVYTSLEIPYQLPERLISPSTILLLQHANCFELSTLLTSLLLGAGYDAYVVSGYAVQECCFSDESKDIYPWPEHFQDLGQKQILEKHGETLKAHDCIRYGVREPNQFQSSYERRMTEREATKLRKAAEKKKQEEEMRKKSELEQNDELRGQRVHSWVLVLSGCHGVGKPFFVEPSTGRRRPLTSARYLGIESVWNHQNLWVNMQPCPYGIQGLNYDLEDTTDWESVLPRTNSQSLCPHSIHELLPTNMHRRKEITVDETDIKMPRSWVERLSVTQSDFELRYPQGYKRRNFKGVQLEFFAPRLMPTGIIRRLICCEDPESKSITSVLENFKHRSDKLYLRHIDLKTGWIVERFHPGHMEHIKDHRYRPRRGERSEHHLLFYNNARADGLEEVNDSVDEFRQRFANRSDCLLLRHVIFDGDDYDLSDQDPRRHISIITELYDRNNDKQSYNDISKIVYDFLNNEMLVTYHSDDEKVSNVQRKFTKPENTDELREFTPWEPDCYSAYLNHPRFKEVREFEKYQLFTDLLKAEQESVHRFLAAEKEVQSMVNSLQQKDEDVVLEKTVFNIRQYAGAKNNNREPKILMQEKSTNVEDLDQSTTLQNLDEKKNLENVEKKNLENVEKKNLENIEGRWHQKKMKSQYEDRVEKKVLGNRSTDYMSPYLYQLEETDAMSRKTALQLRQMCLDDFKSRMVEQAGFIQERYDKANDFLQKNTDKYAEKDFITSCRKAVLDLRISERRLQRHKEKAPHKFSKLEKRIESDPRFAKYFSRSLSQEASSLRAFPKDNNHRTHKN